MFFRMLFGIVFCFLCLVSREGHFGMLKLLFVCGGNHELCDQCCHRLGILVKSCILAVLFVLAVRSVGFLVSLDPSSSKDIPVLDFFVCHSNDKLH